MKYLFNLLISIDQFVNALRGGSPDETLSAAAFRTEIQGKWGGRIFRPLIDLLFRPFQKEHCRSAYIAELKRKQFPRGYQDGL